MNRPRTGFPFLDAGRDEGAVLAFAHCGGRRRVSRPVATSYGPVGVGLSMLLSGHQAHGWTVDDPEEMRMLLGLGVDGLMTDRTDVLRDVLVDRGQWPGAPA